MHYFSGAFGCDHVIIADWYNLLILILISHVLFNILFHKQKLLYKVMKVIYINLYSHNTYMQLYKSLTIAKNTVIQRRYFCNLLQSKIIIFLHHKAMLFWKNHLVTKLILICSWYSVYVFTMLENTDQNSVDFFIKSLRISSVWRSFIFYWREDKEHGRYAPKSACITLSWPSAR